MLMNVPSCTTNTPYILTMTPCSLIRLWQEWMYMISNNTIHPTTAFSIFLDLSEIIWSHPILSYFKEVIATRYLISQIVSFHVILSLLTLHFFLVISCHFTCISLYSHFHLVWSDLQTPACLYLQTTTFPGYLESNPIKWPF